MLQTMSIFIKITVGDYAPVQLMTTEFVWGFPAAVNRHE